MFPALREKVLGWLGGAEPAVQSLGLKDYGFDTTLSQLAGLEARNADWYWRNGYPAIYSALVGGGPAWSGEQVSVRTALNHSVVFCCTKVISESASMIPLQLFQQKGESKAPATAHPMYTGMHDLPNDEMTAMTFRETLTSHCVLQGNAYALVSRRSGTGTAIELNPLIPSQVTPDREQSGQKRLVYVVTEKNVPDKTYTVQRNKPQDILHIRGLGSDGVRGLSVLTLARQSIGTALATERNVARFYANGGRVPYNLKMSKDMKEEDKANFRSDWQAVYSQPHLAPILPSWLDYQQTGLNARDSQLLESRQFTIPEICRWFRVSPHLVGDLSRATFSNIEQLAQEFVTFTLSAWLKRWEEELFRCVLTPDERASGYFFRHNVNALLRGDFAARMAGYASALQNGHMNRDEVRDLEDRNPIPDGSGKEFTIQLNMQSLPVGHPDPAAALVAARNQPPKGELPK